MRRIFFLTLVVLGFVLVSPVSAQDRTDYLSPGTWLLGYFEADRLLEEPHESWYNKEFDSYEIDSEAFLELSELDLNDIEILIVLGTWCPDSRREVPRFMKLVQSLGFGPGKIKLMGTDSFKKAPLDNYEDLNIERVPTFIFYRNNSELGRIIEYPKESLEKDMLTIFGVKE